VVTVTRAGDDPLRGGATVLMADISVNDFTGIIHIIDIVLLPPQAELLDSYTAPKRPGQYPKA
jgi:uncharacterized surface protein with fasciclin (FAS1) repeats